LKAATEKLPAGILTTLFAGAEVSALWIVVAVTLPPKSVLQAAVTQFAHVPLGGSMATPDELTTPTVRQSVARLGAMIPDQGCADPVRGPRRTNKRAMKGRIIVLAPL